MLGARAAGCACEICEAACRMSDAPMHRTCSWSRSFSALAASLSSLLAAFFTARCASRCERIAAKSHLAKSFTTWPGPSAAEKSAQKFLLKILAVLAVPSCGPSGAMPAATAAEDERRQRQQLQLQLLSMSMRRLGLSAAHSSEPPATATLLP